MFNAHEHLRGPAAEDILCRNCGHPFGDHGSDGLNCNAEADDDSGDLCTCSFYDSWDSQPSEIVVTGDATLEELIAIRKAATEDGRMAPAGLSLRIQSLRDAELQRLELTGIEQVDPEALRLLNAKCYEDALLLLETGPGSDRVAARQSWQCYMGLNRPRDAIATLLKVPDKDAGLFQLMARSHLELEEWESAAACARAALDRRPSAGALELLAEATIAGREQYEWSEELQSEVWSLLRQAIEFPDRSEWTYLRLLEAAPDGETSLGQEDIILAVLRQGIAHLPAAWELRERLATRLDIAAAAEEIIAVLTAIPATNLSISARVRACDAYARLGRVSKAIEQLEAIDSDDLNRFDETQFLKAAVYYPNASPDAAWGALNSIRGDTSPALRFHAALFASVLAFERADVSVGFDRFESACSLFFDEPSISSYHVGYLRLLAGC